MVGHFRVDHRCQWRLCRRWQLDRGASRYGYSSLPAATDTANFNAVGTYTVTFTQNEASDELFVTAGTVSFQSDSSTLRTYSFTPDGGRYRRQRGRAQRERRWQSCVHQWR